MTLIYVGYVELLLFIKTRIVLLLMEQYDLTVWAVLTPNICSGGSFDAELDGRGGIIVVVSMVDASSTRVLGCWNDATVGGTMCTYGSK